MQEKFSIEQIAKIYSGWVVKLQQRVKNRNELLQITIRAAGIYFGIYEEWKDIPDHEMYYQVSNFGRIKSLSREIFNG